jgi:hypothetical protein
MRSAAAAEPVPKRCDRGQNGLSRFEPVVSELQLTAATEIVARTARRNTLSERPGRRRNA